MSAKTICELCLLVMVLGTIACALFELVCVRGM